VKGSIAVKNLAISNIAWSKESDALVAGLMREYGLKGVELAPTKYFDKPLLATDAELLAVRRFWEAEGFPIVAMQSLLFGRPDLTLFGTDAQRAEMLDYLEGVFRIAGAWGAGPLVFGSPKNRTRGAMPLDEALAVAVTFFREAGERAVKHNTQLCLEANPVQYQCDFVTTVGEALALVQKVNHPGFGLHVDCGEMTLMAEDHAAVIRVVAPFIRLVHVSEPFLGPTGEASTDHDKVAAALRAVSYPRWVSVEMRGQETRDLETELRRVFGFLARTYGD
jgi:sugar phosphate isomerase/epimerase